MLKKKRDSRRERIKAVALELFASQGYHFTSTNMIIEQAGVSKGLLFFHFPTKEDLLNELLFEWMDQVWKDIVPAENPAKDPLVCLDDLMEAIFQSLEKYEAQYRLYYAIMLTGHPFTSRKDLRRVQSYVRLQQYMLWLFRRLRVKDAKGEIKLFSALMFGTEMNFLVVKKDRRKDFQRLKTTVLKMYRGGRNEKK